MATKTAATKGRKSTTKRAAGKTAKAVPTLPRSAKQVAAWLEAREARRPGFIREVWGLMKTTGSRGPITPTRVAQDMPRESATH
jgi:hypothetical protein